MLLSPILTHFENIYYQLLWRGDSQIRKRHKHLVRFIGLMETCLEAGPQIILQIIILLKNDNWDINNETGIRIFYFMFKCHKCLFIIIVFAEYRSILMSFTMICWTLTYAARLDQENLDPVPRFFNFSTHFIWHSSAIASQLWVLSLSFTRFPIYLSIICFIHWLLLFIVASRVESDRHSSDNLVKRHNYRIFRAVSFILDYTLVYDFLKKNQEESRIRVLLYYCFILLHNTILLVWIYFTLDDNKTYKHIAVFVIPFGLHLITFVFMVFIFKCIFLN